MRIRTAAAVFLTVCFAATPMTGDAAPAGDSASQAATLTVSGQGQISRAPDVATVAATIVTSDESATRALSENNRRYAALSAKLGAVGIADGDISSTSINSYFNARPLNPAPGAAGGPFGFVVTRNVQIKVNTLASTGSVVDAATAAGATQINGVSYGLRDRRGVERLALAAAVTDAAAQAQTIAAAAHVTIVRVLHIGDQTGSPGRIQPFGMALARAVPESVPTTIAPSDLEITAAISITYQIR